VTNGTERAANGRRILVVEDDPSSRRALVALLRLAGYQAVFATNLAQALDLVETAPDFILLDLMLPDGTGAAVLKYVRAQRLPIRVAITTGAADWRTLLHDCDHPPDAVFTKPLDFDRITQWLGVV